MSLLSCCPQVPCIHSCCLHLVGQTGSSLPLHCKSCGWSTDRRRASIERSAWTCLHERSLWLKSLRIHWRLSSAFKYMFQESQAHGYSRMAWKYLDAKISADTRSDVIDGISLFVDIFQTFSMHLQYCIKLRAVRPSFFFQGMLISSSRRFESCCASDDVLPLAISSQRLLENQLGDIQESNVFVHVFVGICEKNCCTTGSSVSLTLKSPGFNVHRICSRLSKGSKPFATLPTLKDWQNRRTWFADLILFAVSFMCLPRPEGEKKEGLFLDWIPINTLTRIRVLFFWILFGPS